MHAHPFRIARRRAVAQAALALMLGLPLTAAQAQNADYRLQAQPLDQTLTQIASQGGLQLLAPAGLTSGLQAPAVQGNLSAEQAANRALAGTGLVARREGQALVIERAPSRSVEGTLPEVVVTAGAQDGTTEGTGSYTTGSMNTATKLALSIRETPQSVTVITRQRMEDEGMTNMLDALKATPGVTVKRNGPNRPEFYARGYYIDNVMSDGLAGSQPGAPNDNVDASPDMAMYDRIEVVRGSTGLMQGSGNPAASVNLIRKRPTKETRFSLTGHAGSWDNYRTEVDVSGSLNEAGTLRGRFVSSYQNKASFQDYVSSENNLFYAVGEADLGSRTTLTFGASQQKNRNNNSWGGLPVAADGSDLYLPRSTYLGNDWEYWDQDNTTVFAELEHRFDSGWNLRLAGTRSDSYREYLGTYLNLVDGGAYNQRGGYYEYDHDQNSYDLYASGPFQLLGREHELVFGASSRKSRVDAAGRALGLIASDIDIYGWDYHSVAKPVIPELNYFSDTQTEQKGAYVTARLNVADPLKLILGARLNWWDYENRRNDGDNYKVTREPVKYAGLVYDLNPQHSAYVSYTDIFQPQNSYGIDGNLLDPVVGKNYEVGIKGEYFDGRLNASAALFRMDQENIAQRIADQGTCPSYPGTVCHEAIGLVRSQGVDLEVQGALTPDWQMAAGYTYVDHRIRKNPDDTSREGQRASTDLPRHQFKLSTNYRIDGQWRVGGGLRWQDGIRQSSTSKMAQGAYALVDLSLGYRFNRHLDFQFNINNVFDKRYWDSPSSDIDYPTANYGTPRNFVLTARYQF